MEFIRCRLPFAAAKFFASVTTTVKSFWQACQKVATARLSLPVGRLLGHVASTVAFTKRMGSW